MLCGKKAAVQGGSSGQGGAGGGLEAARHPAQGPGSTGPAWLCPGLGCPRSCRHQPSASVRLLYSQPRGRPFESRWGCVGDSKNSLMAGPAQELIGWDRAPPPGGTSLLRAENWPWPGGRLLAVPPTTPPAHPPLGGQDLLLLYPRHPFPRHPLLPQPHSSAP